MSLLTYLDLSTAHVSDATATLLDGFERGLCTERLQELNWPAMTIAPYDYGWFLTVPPDDEEEDREAIDRLPADLAHVMIYARRIGVDLLRFDKDADFIDGLPVYEW